MSVTKYLTINSKQIEILILLYRFRFLNTSQIQKLMNHDSPRTAQSWLSDLVQKQYVYSNFDRKKFGKNTKPSVFHLLPNAIKVLKKQEDCNRQVLRKVHSEGERSDGFIRNSLFLADIYLNTKEKINGSSNLHFSTKVDLNGYNYFPDPLPDAYMALKEKKKTNRYFVLLLEDKAPKYALIARIKKYINYIEEDTWKTNTEGLSFPSILVICPDYPKKRFITRFIEENTPKEPLYLTTKNQVRFKGIKSDIWEEVG